MIAVDTSVAIPSMLTWHPAHESVSNAVHDARIPANSFLESYSVMTRLPPPHRVDAATARALLESRFHGKGILTVPAHLARTIVGELATRGIDGGASYDALCALTADAYGATLLSRDHRAAKLYDALGIEYELLD